MARAVGPTRAEGAARRGCAFCGRSEAPFAELPKAFAQAVCCDCIGRLARFVLASPRATVARFWTVRAYGEPLGAQIPERIPAAEVGTHADLAVAYCEMNLGDDALPEAAVALLYGPRFHPPYGALEVLLGPRLRCEGPLWVEELRAALFPV